MLTPEGHEVRCTCCTETVRCLDPACTRPLTGHICPECYEECLTVTWRPNTPHKRRERLGYC